jgi:DNA repair protein RecO (recombination protein O)
VRVAQQPAFILHRYNYSETSLLLEAFTRDLGRVGLIAKGARRGNSEQRALLNPFQPLLIDWTGRGELATLMRADAEQPAVSLQAKALYCGFYLNELLLRLLVRHDPHEDLFSWYQQALERLQNAADIEASLRVFEKRLLQAIGYGLVLDRTADGESIDAGREYVYVPDRGAVPAEKRGLVEGAAIHGAALLGLHTEELRDEGVLRESKMLLRSVLAQYIGDKPLQSVRLFRKTNSPKGES